MTGKIEDSTLPITVEREATEFEGFRKVTTYDYREDESGLRATRELVGGNNAVALVVFDPALDKLVLIRQFRLGAQLATGRGMTVEIVAGLIDEGEDPADCARRELLEETGLTATKIVPLCKFLTTPGLTTETIQLFYAEGDASNLQSSCGVESETEQTFPFLVTLEEALAAVDHNDIYNGIAMIGLLWFQRHRAELTGQAS